MLHLYLVSEIVILKNCSRGMKHKEISRMAQKIDQAFSNTMKKKKSIIYLMIQEL
jgi:hypothetical protein